MMDEETIEELLKEFIYANTSEDYYSILFGAMTTSKWLQNPKFEQDREFLLTKICDGINIIIEETISHSEHTGAKLRPQHALILAMNDKKGLFKSFEKGVKRVNKMVDVYMTRDMRDLASQVKKDLKDGQDIYIFSCYVSDDSPLLESAKLFNLKESLNSMLVGADAEHCYEYVL